MKKRMIFIGFLVLLFSISAFAVEQKKEEKADLVFSLTGGTLRGGKFAVDANLIFADSWGDLFVQTSVMVHSNKVFQEYGISTGLGYEPGQLGFFVFGDGLYKDDAFYFQVRPTIRLRFQRFSLFVSYAHPITQEILLEKQVRDPVFWHDDVAYYYNIETIKTFGRALKYWAAELSVVPIDWAKVNVGGIYVEDESYRYRIGAEVRISSWCSLGVDWQKSKMNLFSEWGNYNSITASLNIAFGSRQSEFRNLIHRKHITPHYPLIVKESKTELITKKIADKLKIKARADKEEVCVEDPVKFFVSVSGGQEPYSFKWDFQDGKTSNEQNPSHIFTKPGVYCITVDVSESSDLQLVARDCVCIKVDECKKCEEIVLKDDDFVVVPWPVAKVGDTIVVEWKQPENAEEVRIYRNSKLISTAMNGFVEYVARRPGKITFRMVAKNECSEKSVEKTITVERDCDPCIPVFFEDKSLTLIKKDLPVRDIDFKFFIFNSSKICPADKSILKWKVEYQYCGKVIAQGSMNIGLIPAGGHLEKNFHFDWRKKTVEIKNILCEKLKVTLWIVNCD